MSQVKIPRWGTGTAAPHERLIHLRRGQVLLQEQGGRCFKRPGEGVTGVLCTLEAFGVQLPGQRR